MNIARPGRRAALAACALALSAGPFFFLAAKALENPAEAASVLALFAKGPLAASAGPTLAACLLCAFFGLAFSLPLACIASARTLAWAPLADFCAVSPLFFAPYAAAGAWASISPGLAQGIVPMSAQIGLSCSPWLYAMLRAANLRIPRLYAEAARCCGLSPSQALLRARLRLLFAPCAAGALFCAARAFGDFGCAERNGAQTFGAVFHSLWRTSQSDPAAAALGAACALPALAAGIACAAGWRSLFPQTPAHCGTGLAQEGAPPAGPLLGACAWALALAPFAFGFLAPEIQYLRWASETAWPSAPNAWNAAWQTFAHSAACALALAAFCALYALAAKPGRGAGYYAQAGWLACSHLFYPPIALAVGWVFATADGGALAHLLGGARDSAALPLAAQFAKFMPFALLPVCDALARESPYARDALACCAARRRDRAMAALRHYGPALLFGAAFVFAECAKELECASVLQPFGYQALSIKIHALARFQNERQAAFWVLASQAMIALPALALLTFLRKAAPRRIP